MRAAADTNMLWELYSKQPFVPAFDQGTLERETRERLRENDLSLIALEYSGSAQ